MKMKKRKREIAVNICVQKWQMFFFLFFFVFISMFEERKVEREFLKRAAYMKLS